MPRVKLFVKEVIIHEKEIDMPDDLYHQYLDDDLDVDGYASSHMDDSTRGDVYDWIHGEIEKVQP